MDKREKLDSLKNWFSEQNKVAVAYSGGIDSTLLLKIGYDILGKNVFPVTVSSPLNSPEELETAKEMVDHIGVEGHLIIEFNDLESPVVRLNPNERCYYCKKNRFLKMREILSKNDQIILVEGTNHDDLNDYRPGKKALDELQIESPLLKFGFSKEDIREISRELGLPNWNKVPEPCLATRFPVGTEIKEETLEKIRKSESTIKKALGIEVLRVRVHNDLARIETTEDNFLLLIKEKDRIIKELTDFGFRYISLDLSGYKKGNMN